MNNLSQIQLYFLYKQNFKNNIKIKKKHCNHSASYDDFSILTLEIKKFLLELRESLTEITRDKPSLNRNITLAPLYLFDRP